ncbi:MAG TPA: HEAT repeat domain-containing protein [Terriglobales bacterium]|nr:HEAT repeat domain-containing protein [Terriglobales bacterium]
MGEAEDNLERRLANWKDGKMSLEETADIAREIGKRGLLSGVPLLLKLLQHTDCIVRYNAILSLAFELHQKSATEKLLSIAANDEDDDCRRGAAAGLGHLFQNSRDRRIIAALGNLALNDPDEYVRRSSYKYLLIVNGVSNDEHLSLLRDTSIEVDPEVVEQILSAVRS